MRERTHPKASPSEVGSALLEAVIGLGLLAILVASVTPIHRSVVETALRSAALLDAGRIADDALERVKLGGGPSVGSSEGSGVRVEVVRLDGGPTIETCEDRSSGSHGHHLVTARQERWASARAVELPGLVRPAQGPDDPALVRLIVPPGTVDASRLALLVGGERVEGQGAGACLLLGALSRGRHSIVADADDDLIGPLHVPLADHPLPLTVHGEVVDRLVRVAAASRVRVDVDPGVGRLPDEVGSGALRWFVRDDDLRVARALGERGPVHPGRTTLVVSACRNPEAPASALTVDLPAGSHADLSVPLANVRIDGIGLRGDATLLAVRTTGCSDASGLRPTLQWDRSLSDGMVVALPHGEWEVRLQTASGSPLTFPVRMAAGVPGLTVTMP